MGGEGVESIEGGPVAIGAEAEGGDGGDGDDSVEGCTCVLWIAAAVPSSSACACAIIASACSSSMSSSSLCTWSIVSTISTVSLDDAHEPPLPGGSGICISGTAAAPCTPKPPIVKNVVLSACTGSAAAACTIAAAAAFLSLLPVGARRGTKSMPSFAACFRRASSIFLSSDLFSQMRRETVPLNRADDQQLPVWSNEQVPSLHFLPGANCRKPFVGLLDHPYPGAPPGETPCGTNG